MRERAKPIERPYLLCVSSFAMLMITACGAEENKNDGIVAQCLMMQEKNPENTKGGYDECACVSEKLDGLLTEDHYAILEAHNRYTVDIANQLPDLHGVEYAARTLKALSVARNESPTFINAELQKVGSVTMPAFRWCGVFKPQ